MQADLVIGFDVSKVCASLGGQADSERGEPAYKVLDQARKFIDGQTDGLMDLVVFQGEFTDDGEFLRVTKRLFSATEINGKYTPSPNTNENQERLQSAMKTYQDKIKEVRDGYVERAIVYYKEKGVVPSLLDGVDIISPEKIRRQ